MTRVLSRFVVVALAGFCCAASQAESVRIATSEYPPFQGRLLPQHGIVGEMIADAFALEGLEVEYGYFPWKRGYQYVKEGKWDAAPYWGWNRQRGEQFLFSDEPILTVQVVFFHLVSTEFDWRTLDDLQAFEIGGIDGYNYSDAFNTAADAGALNVSWSANQTLNFKKLLRGRVTIFPQGLSAGRHQIQRMLERGEMTQAEADSITWHPRPLVERKLYLLFARNRQPLVDAFNRGFGRLRAQAEHKAYWRWLMP